MSEKTKLAIVAAVLLALVPLWNFVAQGAGGVFRALKNKQSKAHAHEAAEQMPKLPIKIGQPGAVVKITAFVDGGNPCHAPTVEALKNLAQEYSPQQVALEILDRRDAKVAAAAAKAKIGCEMGVLVNGRTVHRVPGRGLVFFQGAFQEEHNWSPEDLRAVVDSIIEKKTGARPNKRARPTTGGVGAMGSASACQAGEAATATPTAQESPKRAH
jgi:hypothetical protein